MKSLNDDIRQYLCDDLGLEFDHASATSTKITLDMSDTLPFLQEGLAGRTTTRVDIHDLTSLTAHPMAGQFPHVKSLSIVLHPDTNRIVKAASPWPADVAKIASFPGVREEQRQLEDSEEEFLDLPAASPTIGLFRALKSVQVFGPEVPESARQIIAYYVAHKTVRYESKSVWIIQTRGITPFEASYRGSDFVVPEDYRNHIRHVIDAETGDWLSSDTLPQPELPPVD